VVDEENECGVLPPPMPAMDTPEKTYPNLLAPLGADATVWAELLFADPVADIAVLGSPKGMCSSTETRPSRTWST
jgi:hypothetical protein